MCVQAFARLSAVYGGTYMLAKPDATVVFDEAGQAGVCAGGRAPPGLGAGVAVWGGGCLLSIHQHLLPLPPWHSTVSVSSESEAVKASSVPFFTPHA